MIMDMVSTECLTRGVSSWGSKADRRTRTEGDGPMIWLDGLDLPIYHKFPTHFAEGWKEERFPSK